MKRRRNPPLALFMGNPPMRTKGGFRGGDVPRQVQVSGVISGEAHSIAYKHVHNGKLYKHDFETPVSLLAATMGGKRVVIIVGDDADIWDDYPDEE